MNIKAGAGPRHEDGTRRRPDRLQHADEAQDLEDRHHRRPLSPIDDVDGLGCRDEQPSIRRNATLAMHETARR